MNAWTLLTMQGRLCRTIWMSSGPFSISFFQTCLTAPSPLQNGGCSLKVPQHPTRENANIYQWPRKQMLGRDKKCTVSPTCSEFYGINIKEIQDVMEECGRLTHFDDSSRLTRTPPAMTWKRWVRSGKMDNLQIMTPSYRSCDFAVPGLLVRSISYRTGKRR